MAEPRAAAAPLTLDGTMAAAARCRAAMAALEPAIAAIAGEFGETTLQSALLNLCVARAAERVGNTKAALALVSAARGLLQRDGADA